MYIDHQNPKFCFHNFKVKTMHTYIKIYTSTQNKTNSPDICQRALFLLCGNIALWFYVWKAFRSPPHCDGFLKATDIFSGHPSEILAVSDALVTERKYAKHWLPIEPQRRWFTYYSYPVVPRLYFEKVLQVTRDNCTTDCGLYTVAI